MYNILAAQIPCVYPVPLHALKKDTFTVRQWICVTVPVTGTWVEGLFWARKKEFNFSRWRKRFTLDCGKFYNEARNSIANSMLYSYGGCFLIMSKYLN